MAPLPVDVTVLRRLTACCCYGAVSIMITLFNKAVFSVYRFTYPNVVTTYQIIVSIAYLFLLQRLRWMDLGSFSLKSARQVLMWHLTTFGAHCKALSVCLADLYAVPGRRVPLSIVQPVRRCSP